MSACSVEIHPPTAALRHCRDFRVLVVLVLRRHQLFVFTATASSSASSAHGTRPTVPGTALQATLPSTTPLHMDGLMALSPEQWWDEEIIFTPEAAEAHRQLIDLLPVDHPPFPAA